MSTRSRKLTGPPAAVLGYFEELRHGGLESYYSPVSRNGKGEPDDIVFDEVWGKGAARLGLEQLTRAQFTELAQGRWNGKQLVGWGHRKVVDKETGEERTERVRTTAIDVVIATPKSVGEFLLAIDDEVLRAQVIAAFKESVKAAFENMEAHAAVARVPVQTPTERGHTTVEHGPRAGEASKMQGSRTKRVPAELIGIPVIQLSARPTDETIRRGSPPDIHLHAHMVLPAIGWVPDDADPSVARTYTPDEQGIRATAAERDAVVMGEFARRLEDLGIRLDYSIDREGRITWEIHGSDANIRRFFSTNGEHAHALRRMFEREHGRSPTDGELTKLRDMTRRRKDADAKHVDQWGAWDRWRAAVKKAGLHLKAPKLVPSGVKRTARAERENELHARVFDRTGLAREDAVFTRDTVRATIARCAIGLGFTRDDLAQFGRDIAEELVLVSEARDSRFDLFTTVDVIEMELAIAEGIERKAHETSPAPRRTAIDRAIERSRVALDHEQRRAVERMCSRDSWVMLQGHAGTGKTATLKAVVDAYRHVPRVGRPVADEVIVVSTAAAVAERTGRPLEADRTWSIDAFATAVRMGAFTPSERTLILVEEAAMVDNPRIRDLLDAAGRATIRTIGDPAQLTPIGPGGWYADAAQRHGVHELERVYRQKDDADVRDYRQVREGAAAQALTSLKKRGRVHIAENRSHAVQCAVDMYRHHRDAGRTEGDVIIVLEGSNHEVDTVNRLVQDEREQSEEIAGPGYEVRATDTNRRWTLHTDDLVIFLEHYDRDKDKRDLPRGKRQRRVDNGETGAIVNIDVEHKRALVAMDRGDVITVNLEEEQRTQPMGLAYAVHIAKYEGAEAPIAIVLPSSAPIASQNSGYTQLTRAELEAHVILDKETHGEKPVETLARAWSQPAAKRTAVGQLDPEVVAHALAADKARRADQRAPRRRARRQEASPEEPVTRDARANDPTAPAAREDGASPPTGVPPETGAEAEPPAPHSVRPPPSPAEPQPHDDDAPPPVSEREIVERETEELLVDTVDLYRAAEAGSQRTSRPTDPSRTARNDIAAAPSREGITRDDRQPEPPRAPETVRPAEPEHDLAEPERATRANNNDGTRDRRAEEQPAHATGPTLSTEKVWVGVTQQEEHEAALPELTGPGGTAAVPPRPSEADATERQRSREAKGERERARFRRRLTTARGRPAAHVDDDARRHEKEIENVPPDQPQQNPYRDSGRSGP